MFKRSLSEFLYIVLTVVGLSWPVSAIASDLRCEDLFVTSKDKTAAFARAYNVDMNTSFNSLYDSLKDKFEGPVVHLDRSWSMAGDGAPVFKMSVRDANHDLEPYVLPPMGASKFPYAEFLGETWSIQQDSFTFLNVGSFQMRHDAQLFEQLYQQGVKEAPGRDLVFAADPIWLRGQEILGGWQNWNSNEVTQLYLNKKPYLSKEQLYELRSFDRSDDNDNDYLVVLKDSSINPLQMTEAQYKNNLLATVRLARMRSTHSVLPKSLIGKFCGFDILPVVRRAQYLENMEKIQRLMQGLEWSAGKRIAEISRFARFQDTPPEVMDLLLTRLFEIAMDETDPIDIFFISVDKFTRRLFEPKYRFKELAVLSEEDSSNPEYLMYLDTKSEDFKKTFQELRARSKAVSVHKNTLIPAPSTWAKPWESPPSYMEGSHQEKIESIDVALKSYKTQVIHGPQAHIRWKVPNLSDDRPENLQRVLQIVDWVTAGNSLPRILAKRLSQLTQDDEDILFRNVDLFTFTFSGILASLRTEIAAHEKALIYQNGSEDFVDILKQSGGNFVQGDLSGSEKFDRIIIIGEIEKFSKDADKINLLKRAAGKLNPRGRIVLLDSFTTKSTPPKGHIEEVLFKYAKWAYEQGAPMSEKDLALNLAMRRKFFESYLDRVPDKDIVQLTQEAGLVGGGGGFYGHDFGGWMLSFRLPRP